MKFFKNTLFFALLVVFSATASAQYLEYTATDASKLWFDGTSTLHDFTCHANAIDATVVFSPDLLNGAPGATQQGTVTVPVEQITHENDGLTKNMYKVLEPEVWPHITFAWNSIQVNGDEQADNDMNGTIRGALTIKGETREVQFPVEIKGFDTADTLQVVGDYALYLSNFDIKRPSFFLGTLKVGDEINIKFDMTFAQTNRYEELTQR